MPQAPTSPALRYIRKLIGECDLARLTDGQLLQRFLGERDEDAFAALMERHGNLVLKVCRQVLHHEQDAEDAFQATFLVLARHAGCIRKTEAIGSWLYRVAYRIATKAGTHMGKQRAHERQVRGTRAPTEPEAELGWRELQAALSQELNCLPEKYRAPFVLCCLEGKSGSEAARQLGWKEGTVSARLAQARKRLQQRLSRRGITLAAVLCGMALTQHATAALPATVFQSTMKAAQLLAQGKGVSSGMVSARVATLVQGVTKAMFFAKLRIATVFLLAAGGIGITTGMVYEGVIAQESQFQQKDRKSPAARGSGRNLRLARNPQDNPAPKSDKERIQGAWSVVSVEFNGQDVTKAVGDMKWFCKGDRLDFSTKLLPDDVRITFKQESTGSPKSVDFILKNASQAETMKGIYELKDDILKVCVHVQRPKSDRRSSRPKLDPTCVCLS
jgi:RNA polymerase sigma factor (sigma-70 family)